ncbi:ras-related protein RABH1b-like, partial [Trifolium pratense]
GRQTFLNTSRWIEEVRSERGSDVIVVLVGNKTDLVDKRGIISGEKGARSVKILSSMAFCPFRVVATLPGNNVAYVLVIYGFGTQGDFARQVSTEEGEAKSRELNVMFIEASAKAGFNIKALFRKIAAALPGMETLSSTKQEDMVDVNLRSSAGHDSQPQSGGCAC